MSIYRVIAAMSFMGLSATCLARTDVTAEVQSGLKEIPADIAVQYLSERAVAKNQGFNNRCHYKSDSIAGYRGNWDVPGKWRVTGAGVAGGGLMVVAMQSERDACQALRAPKPESGEGAEGEIAKVIKALYSLGVDVSAVTKGD